MTTIQLINNIVINIVQWHEYEKVDRRRSTSVAGPDLYT